MYFCMGVALLITRILKLTGSLLAVELFCMWFWFTLKSVEELSHSHEGTYLNRFILNY
jgi:hypothetical protein